MAFLMSSLLLLFDWHGKGTSDSVDYSYLSVEQAAPPSFTLHTHQAVQ